eukprot:6443280-Pyramimonas_sp.AAC.1
MAGLAGRLGSQSSSISQSPLSSELGGESFLASRFGASFLGATPGAAAAGTPGDGASLPGAFWESGVDLSLSGDAAGDTEIWILFKLDPRTQGGMVLLPNVAQQRRARRALQPDATTTSIGANQGPVLFAADDIICACSIG